MRAFREYLHHSVTRKTVWRVAIILVILASGALVAAAVYRNRASLSSHPLKFDYRLVVVPLLLYPVAAGIPAVVWGGVLRQLGSQHDHRQDLRIFCATALARRLPTSLWFLAGRTYLCSEIGVPISTTYLATAVEFVLLLLSALIVLQGSLILGSELPPLEPYRPALAFFTGVTLLGAASPRLLQHCVNRVVQRLKGNSPAIWHIDRRHMAIWTASYAIAWVTGGIILYLLICAVHPLPLRKLPDVVAIWAAGGATSHIAALTIGGIGAKEITIAALLAIMIPAPIALVIPIFTRLWYYVNELLWFLLASLWAQPHKIDATDDVTTQAEDGAPTKA